MLAEPLTPDNPLLSRVTKGKSEVTEACAINCTEVISASPDAVNCIDPSVERVADFIANSIADNTRRAYASDLAHFEAWGGTIPAAPNIVASYLAAHADMLSVATLVRRVATISKAHEAKGLSNPCRSEIVRATLRGIKRLRGTAQHEAKPSSGKTCS